MRGEEIQELKKPELWGLHRECELSVRTYYYGTADGFRQEDRFRDDWYFQNRQLASQVSLPRRVLSNDLSLINTPRAYPLRKATTIRMLYAFCVLIGYFKTRLKLKFQQHTDINNE
jgi:hypothetical protein